MTSTELKDFPLYDPRNEHDACGVGFIVNVNAERSHETIMKGIQILGESDASGRRAALTRKQEMALELPSKYRINFL